MRDMRDEHAGDPIDEVFEEYGEHDGVESGFKPKRTKTFEEAKESRSEVKLWRHTEREGNFGDHRMTAGSGEKASFVKAPFG